MLAQLWNLGLPLLAFALSLQLLENLLFTPAMGLIGGMLLGRPAVDNTAVMWYILRSDDKKRARLNCIHHILDLIPYKKVPREKIKLPGRSMKGAYDDQASLKGRKFVAEKY